MGGLGRGPRGGEGRAQQLRRGEGRGAPLEHLPVVGSWRSLSQCLLSLAAGVIEAPQVALLACQGLRGLLWYHQEVASPGAVHPASLDEAAKSMVNCAGQLLLLQPWPSRPHPLLDHIQIGVLALASGLEQYEADCGGQGPQGGLTEGRDFGKGRYLGERGDGAARRQPHPEQ